MFPIVSQRERTSTPGNGEPPSLDAMAEGNQEVQARLRRHGARY